MDRSVLLGLAMIASLVLAACGGPTEHDLLGSARTYLAAKNSSAAIIQIKAALEKNPQSGEARFLLGDALLNSGNPVGAAVELERAREVKYSDDKVLPALAKALLWVGQAQKVIDQYGKVTLTEPRAAAELRAVVASAHISLKQVDLGQVEVNSALQLDPKNVIARMLQTRLTAGRGAFDEALLLIASLAADEPKLADAWRLQGELQWLGKNDAEAAVRSFRQALLVDDRHLQSHLSLIRLLLQKRDLDAAKVQIAALKKALPNQPESLLLTAQLALADQDLNGAREGVQQLLKVAPDNALVRQLAGVVDAQNGALRSAENHLNRALQLEPNLVMARRVLAETHLRSGQPNKVLTTLRPLMSLAKPSADVLALVAEAHLQNGDVTKAEWFFNEAAKSTPNDPKVATSVALMQLARGNVQGGFEQLETLASSDASTFADMALISVMMQRKDLEGALKAINRLQAKLPNKPMPHLLRGRILVQRQDLAAARAAFEKSLSVDGSYFPAVVNLAALDIVERKPEAALKRFEALLVADPKNVGAMLAAADLKQQAGAKPDEIETLIIAAVKAAPTEPQPRLALIEHRLAQRQAGSAIAAAQEAVVAMPDDFAILDALGRAQLSAGETQQAIASFRKIAVAQPALAQPQLRLADAHLANKDYASARQSLRQALQISPDLPQAQRGLVVVALADKRVDEALAVARDVQRRNPKSPAGFLIESEIHAGQRAWDLAIAASRAALERSRTIEVATRLHSTYVLANRLPDAAAFAASWQRDKPTDAQFIFHLGSMAMASKDYAEAERRYREVLALVPDHVTSLNNIAWLLVKQGRPGALAMAERANKLLPDDAVLMDTLAQALAADKQMPRAIEWQLKVVQRRPDVPAYRLTLAKLLVDSGDRVKARTELEKLSQLGAKFSDHAEVAALLKGL